MRAIPRIKVDKEEIARYEHDLFAKQITIFIAKGTASNSGEFIQEPSQSLEVIVVSGSDYEAVIGDIAETNKVSNAITFNKLWTAVDAVRGVL